MGRIRPGFIWMTPADQDGREFQPKIIAASDGKSLEYHFTANVVMDEDAYLRLARDHFKKSYHLESKEEAEKRDNDYYKKEGQFAPE